MFCSSLVQRPRTLIPTAMRNALGSLLRGPPRGKRRVSRQVCLFALGMIGDVVLALSALRRLIEHHGPQHCVLVVSPSVQALARREFPGVEIVLLPSDAPSLTRDILPLWWRERRQFAAYRFDRCVCFNHQRSLYYEVAVSWADATEDFRLQPETYPALTAGLGTELLAHRRVAELALDRPLELAEILPRFTSVPAGDDGRLLVYPLSRDSSRSLPVTQVVAILRHWRAHRTAPVVLGGSPRDLAVLESYAAACGAAGLGGVTVEAPAGVVAFVAHVAAAGAVLSADSAAGHISTAFDKPTVVLTSRDWLGLCQPWTRSARQKVFLRDAPDAEIAAALDARARSDK